MDALGIGTGDEVICPAFTFYATAEAIARRGATPVFADVDAATMNLDPEDVAARISPRTKAILAVHLFGRPAPLAELAQLGVPVIEDAAQAFGSPDIARGGSPPRSASIRRRTSSASGTAALSRRTMPSLRNGSACSAFTAPQGDFELSASTRASTRSRLRCCASSSRELDGWVHRVGGRRRYSSSASARLRASRGRARPRLPPLRLPLARA